MRFSDVTDSLLKRKGGEVWSVHLTNLSTKQQGRGGTAGDFRG